MNTIDERIKEAAELSLDSIEKSLPEKLLLELKTVSKALSVPWVGLLLGMITPVQYAMSFSNVHLENSDWTEPTIMWILQHMPSGTRKSNIAKFVNDLSDAVVNDEDADEPRPQYKVCETTFEKLGLMMQANNDEMIWYSDEARHFFSQLGLYQKPGSVGNRDEAVLLTLYDGAPWSHNTARGVQFSLGKSKLTLGGLSQTGHVMKLFQQKDQMESGLIPRFLTMMLKPVHTSIRDIVSGKEQFYEKIKPILQNIRKFHETKQNYVILRSSPAFELFAQYYETVTSWIEKHQYKTIYQNAITIVSKSIGQIFRLSGILTALFVFWDLDEVNNYEMNSQYVNCTPSMFTINSSDENIENATDGELSDSFQTTVSIMAMEAAINVVTSSIRQNLIIQGIDFFLFNFDAKNIDTLIVDVDETRTTTDDTAPSPPPPPPPKRCEFVKPSVMEEVGKIMCGGGKILREWYFSKNKKLGMRSSKIRHLEIFQLLQSAGFGERDVDGMYSFTFHNNIIERIHSDDKLKNFMIDHLISMPHFQSALRKPSQPEKRGKPYLSESNENKENQPSVS